MSDDKCSVKKRRRREYEKSGGSPSIVSLKGMMKNDECIHVFSCQKMVLKYLSTAVEPPVLLYMGVDKVENEDLIK